MTTRATSETPKHNHPLFGTSVKGCPRCLWVQQELSRRAEPRKPETVAECWTCDQDKPLYHAITQTQADACRKAGHDVREIE